MEYEDMDIEYFDYELSFRDKIAIAKLRDIMRDNDNQKIMSNIINNKEKSEVKI